MTTRADELLSRDVSGILSVLLPFAGVGVVAMGAYCATLPEGRAPAFGLSLALALGAAAVGGVLGFIFGIPRGFRASSDATPPKGEEPSGRQRYQGNSNLEEISDWLAKLLVGAGLTQLTAFSGKVFNFAQLVAPQLGKDASSAYVLGVLVSFTVFGFFLSYLFARRVLPVVFWRADADGSGQSEFERARDNAAMAGALLEQEVDLETVRRLYGARVATLAELPRGAVAPEDQAMWARARLIAGAQGATKDLAAVAEAAPGDTHLRELAVMSALYEKEPEGFTRALELGEAVANKTPRMHMYLAAAWGQKFGFDGKKAEDRARVLEHVKAAVEGDASLKGFLASMLDERNADNDLRALKGDAELEKLLV